MNRSKCIHKRARFYDSIVFRSFSLRLQLSSIRMHEHRLDISDKILYICELIANKVKIIRTSVLFKSFALQSIHAAIFIVAVEMNGIGVVCVCMYECGLAVFMFCIKCLIVRCYFGSFSFQLGVLVSLRSSHAILIGMTA